VKDFKEYYLEGVSILEEAKSTIDKVCDESLDFYLLQNSAQKFLKALISYYGVKVEPDDHIDYLIEQIENQTTIKFPSFKEQLLELAFVPYENGCASSIVYEKRPKSFVEVVDKLKDFVLEEIPIFDS